MLENATGLEKSGGKFHSQTHEIVQVSNCYLFRDRYVKATSFNPTLYAGSLALGYQLIIDFLRHHDEANMRPEVVDHMIAMTLLGTISGFMIGNTPFAAV